MPYDCGNVIERLVNMLTGKLIWPVLMIGMVILSACNGNHQVEKEVQEAEIIGIDAGSSIKDGTLYLEQTKTAENIVAELPPFIHDSTKQYIYLTFDDGPQFGTKSCIQVCKELGVKATFFMIGAHVTGRDDGKAIINDLKANYPQFLLANHSFHHASNQYTYFFQHPAMAFADFIKTQDTLAPPYKIARLPGNNSWVLKDTMRASKLVRALCNKLDSAGYRVFGWDTEWMFNYNDVRPIQSAEKMAHHITYLLEDNAVFTKNHLVLLTHDRMFQRPEYVDSLKKMITILKENPKYVFETIDHYPGY